MSQEPTLIRRLELMCDEIVTTCDVIDQISTDGRLLARETMRKIDVLRRRLEMVTGK